MSTNNRDKNKAARTASDQKILAALGTHFAPDASITVDGKPVKVSDVAALLKARIDATEKVVSAKHDYTVAVQAERDAVAHGKPTLLLLRQALVVTLGSTSSALVDFGIAPRKAQRPLTTEERAAAQAKAKATRALLHTMGSRQKAKVRASAPLPTPSPPLATAPKP